MKKWQNETFRQHFIHQVEQRFNAINPLAAPKNQRIYSFEIVNREAHELRLLNPNGQPISAALAYPDLLGISGKVKVVRSSYPLLKKHCMCTLTLGGLGIRTVWHD